MFTVQIIAWLTLCRINIIQLNYPLYKVRENNLKQKIFSSLLRINMNVNNVTVIIKYLSQTDPCLREIIRSIGDFSIKIRKDPFQSLVESIIYQQLAGSAARVIYSRFIKYYNNDNNNINSRPFFPEQILSTPNSVFRSSIGLSNKKIEYIKDLSAKVIERKLDVSTLHALSDEEVIAQLIQVKGIGRWTAEMFLIFCLGRLDVLPVTDLGIRKADQQKCYL